MTLRLDHILLGVPDLDAGVAEFTALTGVRPVVGGSHPGFGTRNQLVSLGGDVFFELIAPDPAQAATPEGRAAELAAMPRPRLLTFAVQTEAMDAACAAATGAGLTVTRRVAMHRTRPDGVRLDWTVANFAGFDFGPAIPFAIDWQGSPHPSGTTPTGCTLASLTVLHPRAAELARIYAALGLDVKVAAAPDPGFILRMMTPNGEVVFQ